MTNESVKLAVSILGAFEENSSYEDYKREDGWTDEQFQQMLDELRTLNRELASTVGPAPDTKPTVLTRIVTHLADVVPHLMKTLLERGVIDESERDLARTWLGHVARRIRRTVAADGSGLPPYAEVCWTAGDVIARAEENGKVLDEDRAHEFLHNNARQIADDMVARGWESIEALLDPDELEDAEEDDEDDLEENDGPYECQDCGVRWHLENLNPVKDLRQRVAPGEPMPAGACPTCGAVCHEVKDADGTADLSKDWRENDGKHAQEQGDG